MHLYPFLVPAYPRADPFLQTLSIAVYTNYIIEIDEERGAKLLITFAARKWITVCLPLIQVPGSKKVCCTKSRKRMRLARMQPDPHWHLACCIFERFSCMFIWQVFGQVDHSHRPQLLSIWKGQKNLHPPDILAILAGHIWRVWRNGLWKKLSDDLHLPCRAIAEAFSELWSVGTLSNLGSEHTLVCDTNDFFGYLWWEICLQFHKTIRNV